uniref:Kinesin motor domain-containing protein n=1 Tax=Fagus sylvatica TaxID=28930 RepID=A0A2N9IHU0_FAGSY
MQETILSLSKKKKRKKERNGVRGVEEATEADGVWCFPNLENPIYVNKVVKEAAMFVPALNGPNGSQDGDHPKECYEVEYCYEQNEENDSIFSREIKPLILGVFEGCNSTVIACGARGSGKTFVIQGSDEKPGLATLARAEILSMAEQNGKLVPVKSVTEFHKLYASSVCGSCKSVKKIATELPRRNHRGLIVHLVSPSKNADVCLVGKMNFVDLAVINLAVTDTTRKAKSSTRPMVVPSSHKKNRLPGSVPSTVKKHTASQVHFSEKKTNCISSALKGRKLFVKASHQTTSEKASSLPNIVSTVESLEQGKENCILNVNNVTVLSEVENPLAVALKDTESTSVLEKEASPLPTSTAVKTTIPNKDVFLASEVSLHGGDHHEQDTSYVNGSTALSFAEEEDVYSPWETLSTRSFGMKNSLAQEYLRFLNTADNSLTNFSLSHSRLDSVSRSRPQSCAIVHLTTEAQNIDTADSHLPR